MRVLYCIAFLAACAWADEAADRAAIEKIVIAFNHPHERPALLAKDADLGSLGRDSDGWTETSPMLFASRSVRFVTPDVAVVEANASQYGTLIVKRKTDALFVMRRQGTDWKVVLLRVALPAY